MAKVKMSVDTHNMNTWNRWLWFAIGAACAYIFMTSQCTLCRGLSRNVWNKLAMLEERVETHERIIQEYHPAPTNGWVAGVGGGM